MLFTAQLIVNVLKNHAVLFFYQSSKFAGGPAVLVQFFEVILSSLWRN